MIEALQLSNVDSDSDYECPGLYQDMSPDEPDFDSEHIVRAASEAGYSVVKTHGVMSPETEWQRCVRKRRLNALMANIAGGMSLLKPESSRRFTMEMEELSA